MKGKILLLVALAVSIGCGSTPSSTPGASAEHAQSDVRSAAPTSFVVTTSNGTRLVGMDAQLTADYFAARAPEVRLVFSASGKENAQISAVAMVDPGFLETGKGSVVIANGMPARVGTGNVQSGGAPLDTGSLNFVAARNTVEGDITGVERDDSFPMHFQGGLVLQCSVPEDQLGSSASRPPAPVGVGVVAEVLVMDTKLESTSCRQLGSRLAGDASTTTATLNDSGGSINRDK